MKTTTNRGDRIHQTNNVRKKRKSYYGGSPFERIQGMLVHTAKLCSCWMCGNDRKWLGEVTKQEKSFLEISKEFMVDNDDSDLASPK